MSSSPVERSPKRDPYDSDSDSDEPQTAPAPRRPRDEDEGSEDERVQEDGVRGGEDEEEEDEEEDEDEEDDEEDEEDEDEDDGRAGRKRRRKNKRNRFLDVEAEVDDEDEEMEEDEEELGRDAEGFIEDRPEMDEPIGRAGRNEHTRLDRRHREMEDRDAEKVAEELKERYGRMGMRYQGDVDQIPQRLLMPSVNDANIWGVRCKPGRERDLVFSLMRKFLDVEYTSKPLDFISAFCRDSLSGMIYIEARSQAHVTNAINGLVGVYPSRGFVLVPIDEMADLLKIKKQTVELVPGTWVRIKRGKYAGDLAQVMDVTENGDIAGVKFVPRIDLNPKDDNTFTGSDGKKRKKGAGAAGGSSQAIAFRPPQRLYSHADVIKVYGARSSVKRGNSYVFQGDTFKDGFIEKDIKISGLQTEDVNPTLDEITRFTGGDRDGTGMPNATEFDLSVIAEASRKASTAVLQPGDHVEVFEGEQAGIDGTVETIRGDVVTIRARLEATDLDEQLVEVQARSIRKRFKPGAHVKVMAGKNVDETGLVVATDGNTVTLMSDLSQTEVTVFAKDVREAAEIGASTNTVGDYELHDLVQLDQQTAGVIFKTEHNTFRVLDQNGSVRVVGPRQISMRRDSRRAVATDSTGHEMRIGDMVKEIEGEGRKGQVLHIYRSQFAFLHNREISENGGVFVTRARSLASVAPKALGNGASAAGPDLSRMNPALAPLNPNAERGGMVGSSMMGRGGERDRLENAPVQIIRGTHKGMIGIIKGTNGGQVRVELHAANRIITVDRDMCMRRHNNQLIKLDDYVPGLFGPPRGGSNPYMPPPASLYSGGGRSNANPYSAPSFPRDAGGRTPWGGAAADGGRTPWQGGARDGGRTPWQGGGGDGGRTPWQADGGRTPFAAGGRTPAASGWGAATKTPNPYAGGATPAAGGWGAGSKTPAAGGWGAGGRTPAAQPADGGDDPWNAGGKTPGGPPVGRTPNPYTAGAGRGGATPAWGGASVRRPPMQGGATPAWQAPRDPRQLTSAWGGATPGYTPRPAEDEDVKVNVQDIDEDSGPSTLPDSAPTPAAGPYSAPTPGVYGSAPTPYGGSAPTPTAYGGAPTPGAGPYGAPTPAPYGAPTPGGFGATPYAASTPGPGYDSAATPYGGAAATPHTPGVGAYHHQAAAVDRIGPKRDWFVSVKGVEVVIESIGQFEGGKYDKAHAALLSGNDQGGDQGTARVRVLQDGQERTIAVAWIEPIHPGADGGPDKNDEVVILEGEYKGQVATLLSNDDDEWMVNLRDSDATAVLHTYALAKYVEV